MSRTMHALGGLLVAGALCSATQAGAVPRVASMNDNPLLGVLDEPEAFLDADGHPVTINEVPIRFGLGDGVELDATLHTPGEVIFGLGIPKGFACALDSDTVTGQLCTQDIDIVFDTPYKPTAGRPLRIETFGLYGNAIIPGDTVRFSLADEDGDRIPFDVAFERTAASGGGTFSKSLTGDLFLYDVSTDTDDEGALTFYPDLASSTGISRLIIDFLDNTGGGGGFGTLANATPVPLPASALLLLGGLGALALRARR